MTGFKLLPGLGLSGAIPLLPLYAFMAQRYVCDHKELKMIASANLDGKNTKLNKE